MKRILPIFLFVFLSFLPISFISAADKKVEQRCLYSDSDTTFSLTIFRDENHKTYVSGYFSKVNGQQIELDFQTIKNWNTPYSDIHQTPSERYDAQETYICPSYIKYKTSWTGKIKNVNVDKIQSDDGYTYLKKISNTWVNEPARAYITCQSQTYPVVITVYSDYSYSFEVTDKVNYPTSSYDPPQDKRLYENRVCPKLSADKVNGKTQFYLNKTDGYSETPMSEQETIKEKKTEALLSKEQQETENTENLDSTEVINCDYFKEDSELLKMLKTVFTVIQIAGPVLAILLGMVDFTKAIISSDADKEMKTAWNHFKYRLIAAAVLLLVPSILKFLLTIFHEDYVSDDPYCEIAMIEDRETI